MSPDIVFEMDFLFHSFLMGILITILYDILRIARRVIPHNLLAVSVEDFFYWTFCSFFIFAMLIRENNGILRWFSVAGAMAGMFLYKKTLGFLFVKYVSLLFCRLLHLVDRALRLLCRPLYLVQRRLFWARRKSGNRLKMGLRAVKKKLTRGKKMLKMILYKQ